MKQTVSAILVLLLILSGCAAVQLSVATAVPGTTRSDLTATTQTPPTTRVLF